MEQKTFNHLTPAIQEAIDQIIIDDVSVENVHLTTDFDDKLIIVPYIFETPADTVKKFFPEAELMDENFVDFMSMKSDAGQVYTMNLGEFIIEYPELQNNNWTVVVNKEPPS